MSFGNKILLFLAFLVFNKAFAQAAPPAQNTIINTSPGTTIVIPTPPSTVESDGRIVASIYKSFGRDSALIGTNLTVVCKAGVVTLSGNVTAQSQADSAYLEAKRTPGVKEVISKIIVNTNPNSTVQPTPNNY